MTDRDFISELRTAAGARDRAAQRYDLAAARVRALIVEANDAGISMVDVAKAAGINRTRAHKLYLKAKGPKA